MKSIWVSGQFDTTNFATSESQIAKGGDLTFSLWVACRMKLILNESWDVVEYCKKGKGLRTYVQPLNYGSLTV